MFFPPFFKNYINVLKMITLLLFPFAVIALFKLFRFFNGIIMYIKLKNTICIIFLLFFNIRIIITNNLSGRGLKMIYSSVKYDRVHCSYGHLSKVTQWERGRINSKNLVFCSFLLYNAVQTKHYESWGLAMFLKWQKRICISHSHIKNN